MIWILSAEIALRLATRGKIGIGHVAGISVYLAFLVSMRLCVAAQSMAKRRPAIAPGACIPGSVLDIPTSYKLAPMEIVLGFNRKRPIRVDLNEHHTLIAGVTGFGKTYILISILIQLFSKGSRFTDFCDVYLFDYKGDGDDYLSLWKPLLKGYYSIEENSPDEALEKIRDLANAQHGQQEKRILVIIDEIASITAHRKSEANDALMLLAGKLRSRGTLVVATQHPRFDIIPRAVTTNMSRKIAVHVDDRDQAKLIFRTDLPPELMPTERGEFALKEPGVRGFAIGMGIKPSVPEDVIKAVKLALPTDHDDLRVKFLMDTISGLDVGDSIVGINKRVAEARSVGNDIKQEAISANYRNFAEAGIFSRARRGQPHRLAFPYHEAVSKLEDFIGSGSWKDGPKARQNGTQIKE